MGSLSKPANYVIILAVVGSMLLVPASSLAAPANSGVEPSPMEMVPQAIATCEVLQPGPTAAEDSYIKEDKPNELRGGDAELRVKTESGKLNRSLLRFDLTGLPNGIVVTSATLSLYVKGASGGDVTINARGVITSWNESQVTWNDRDKAASLAWTTAGGDYGAVVDSTVVDDTADVWRSWDLTTLATAWVSNPADNYGVILEAAVTNPKTEKKFKSSDDGTADQRPKLEVCYSAAITLSPNNSADAVAGVTKTYSHTVSIGNLTDVVNLGAVSSQGWSTRIYEDENGNGAKDPEDDLISQTPSIGPNATYPILVQVDVPTGLPLGTVDVTTVTATGQSSAASDTATDRTTVGDILSVQPDHSQYATAGSVLFYGHTVSNNSDVQDCVTIAATSSQGWTVLLWEDTNQNGVHETSNPNEPALSNPVCIDPGQAYYLVAEVQVPGGAATGTVDQTVVTATSGNQPTKSDSASDTTEVFVNDPPVIDGKYDEVYRISPDATEVCYTNNGVLFGKLATFYQQSGDVYVVLAIDKDFVDNTYGADTSLVGWPSGGHNFSKLVGSDRAQFWGYDSTATKVVDFDIDYISADGSNAVSGYSTLGLGGDGGMNTGNGAHILEWGTSLDYDLNDLGYCSGGNCSGGGTDLLVDSPPTDAFYTPNPTYPDWIFDVIYEVKIDAAAFAAGFDHMEIPYIHASPSKLGTNTIYAEPGACPGEIGDFVWHDLNHDGVQDAGEPGIDGVVLNLYQDNGDGVFDPNTDILKGQETTTAGGQYLFQDLAPNDYFVDVDDTTVPAGMVITTYNDPTAIIHLSEGESYLQADFGYAEPFADLQISKVLSSADPAYVGQEVSFTIRITNTGSTTINHLPLKDWYDPTRLTFKSATPSASNPSPGVLNWADLTATFGNLAPNQHVEVIVRFEAAAATKSLSPKLLSKAPLADPTVDGLLDSNYSFLKHFTQQGTGNSALAPGNLYGYEGTDTCYWAFVVDRAFNDNVYADKDLDNPYLAEDGWTKHTFKDLERSDHAELTVTYTGGSYSGLWLDYLNQGPQAGQYASGEQGDHYGDGLMVPISEAATSLHWNLLNSNWNGGTWGDPLKHSPPYDYNQTSGEYWEWHMIYEFSILKSQMNGACGDVDQSGAHNSPNKNDESKGRIGDTVWEDANVNGVQDGGEVGLPGVVVNLYQNSVLVRTTETEPGTTGYYIFNNLEAGTYVVDVDESTIPPNYALTSNNEPMTVTLSTGGEFLNADFGYYFQGTGSIGDRVFYDLNGDGLPDDDGEPGINGVTVNLYSGACPASGNPVRTQVTAGNGDYDFLNLLAGDYCVDVDESTLPTGYALTTNNEPLTVNLQDGQDYNDADFGYRAECVDGTPNVALVSGAGDVVGSTVPDVQDYACAQIESGVSIGNYVWEDLNGDGLQSEPASAGLNGVTVSLYKSDGTFVASQVTADDGSGNPGYYLFENQLPADYYLIFSKPTGYEFTVRGATGVKDSDDSDPDPASGQTETFTASPGETDLSWDAGLYRPVTVGDFTWIDTNGDGIYEPGSELPLSGVVVQVENSNGDLVATMTTGPADGFPLGTYLVDDLPPGVYTATVVNWPTGFLPSGATELTSVFLNSGQQDLDLDFPFINTTAVNVLSFTAQQRHGEVVLRWSTLNEAGNEGFHVWRATAADGDYQRLTGQPLASQAMSGIGASYRWVDETAMAGQSYWYRLETVPDGQAIGPVQALSYGGRVFLPAVAK